jgi:uncharacterized membrane protein
MRVFIFNLTLSMLLASGSAAADGNATAEKLEFWVYTVMHTAAGILAAVAVLVMLWGCIRALGSFVDTEVRGGGVIEQDTLRSRLGHFILFGLELLIVADIIETVTAPDTQHIVVLAIIVVIRTVISFSLNWELAQEDKRARRDQT